MFKQKEYKWREKIISLAGILILFSLSACSDKLEEEYIPIEEKSVDVIFNIKAPSTPLTYAITGADENYISEIDVLIFKKDGDREYYAYKAKGEDLAPNTNNSKLNFKVTLKRDDVNVYRFVILTNASEYIDALGGLTTTGVKELVLARIESKIGSSWNAGNSSDFAPIPMWGESNTTYTVNEDTQVGEIPMVRSLSRIDVLSQYLPKDVFELKEVYVYNWKTNGRVVPDLTSEYWSSSEHKALLPSLPTNYETINGTEPLKYTTGDNKFEYEIYIHEAAAPEDRDPLKATALVIGGYYEGNKDQLSYYRVDFKEKDESSQEDVYIYRNILRNHKYVFNIRNVLDEGFADPDTAFTYMKANLTIEITTWNMGEQSETDIGGSFNFSVNQSIFNLNSIITSGILTVTCDHTNGWSIDESQTTGNIKLTRTGDNVLIEATGTGGGSFVLKAGNLSKKIIVNYT